MSDGPTFSEVDIQELIADADPEWQAIPWVYEFPNGRYFYGTDHTDSGVYDGS